MFEPVPLNLPPFPSKITQKFDKLFIFDELRKKDLVLTPEEWVRQHWINFLHVHKDYPKSLMQIEGGLKLNTLQKRSDLLVFNNQGKKILLAEFKAPTVKITEKAFHQIANYNSIHKIPLLLISNGMEHYYCRIDFVTNQSEFLQELPNYNSATNL
ncbi:type I restriction and modification enzyme subunit R-like protein [Sphingobacterium allocomposti]|uniref:Type I restriction and modification enzyme subunit R-like protein n=1 Tax=Sphingobacterium allocomposti TaxID=415956 RepID=A0A5S5DB75_9SPHI|nr:type I restriction enzyme HsdR N-terminal domain-containing protein [Sphingobacterium composti Yoo et al. 2007 non Ten et al. 2007]TYP93121.1 type I restriction and modification enzyme subunit R-like protein [Sphingobacterium composti Yoo et al. 2007 non Ten et al. 2007]HLS96224.1 type I restriction enzyme HsdR N-terminal domain-containing protein [Sphingobacterium sp.]